MLRYAVLAILSLQYVNASSCPSGYDIQAFNSCYKAYHGPSNRSEALIQCSKDGGRLASIHNAFTNALILYLADYVGAANDRIWIGLVCPDTNVKSCVWDDGQIGADQYSAFYPGYPCGNCDQHWVHMFNSKAGDSAGKWASASIYRAKIGYVCEVSTRVVDFFSLFGNYPGFSATAVPVL